MFTKRVCLSPVHNECLIFPRRVGQCDPWSKESNQSISISLTQFDSVVPTQVLNSDSIASVKLRIQASSGILYKKQKLFYDGKELSGNDSSVGDYGLTCGKIVHVVIRPSHLQKITVRTLDKSESKNTRIANRKRNVFDFKNQELMYNDEELEDLRRINDICSKDDVVIHILYRGSVKLKHKPEDGCFELTVGTSESENTQAGAVVSPKAPTSKVVVLEPVIFNPEIPLPSELQRLVELTFGGLMNGHKPIMAEEGTSGVYFMLDSSGEYRISVFKPTDEEPNAINNPKERQFSTDGEGLKKGTRAGGGAIREVAAYILDHAREAGVPPTLMVKFSHESFYHSGIFEYSIKIVKIGSLQKFINNHGSSEDWGHSRFRVKDVHNISMLDIRLANADRHYGNILVTEEGEDGKLGLVPIDHAYCLPETFEDCTLDWLNWPQAKQPYSEATIERINSLDAEQELESLKYCGLEVSVASAQTFRVSTMFLKKAIARGLSPYAIGSMRRRENPDEESIIEKIVKKAKEWILPHTSEDEFINSLSSIIEKIFREAKEGMLPDMSEDEFIKSVSSIIDRWFDESSS